MINLAVVKIRDILKYLVGITTVIVLVVFLTRYFSEAKKEDKANKEVMTAFKQIEQKIYTMCLQTTIPGMKLVQENEEEHQDENQSANKKDPLRVVMETELAMMTSVRSKEERDTEKETNTNTVTNEIQHAQEGVNTEVIPNSVPNKFTNNYHGVQVKNETSYQLTEDMLNPDITVNNQNVMIFHTHTCESYTPTPNFQYEASGSYRTTNLDFSVARVGTELTNQLTSYGYKVVHDTTYHDYPSYNGAYGRSMTTVENLLQTNQSTDVIIDLHRDAIGDSSYAPTVKIGEEEAAQLMFVIGTDGGGLEHPNWNQNLKFAIKLQEKANELYPGLFKPIILRNSRYNQQLGKAANIIEVGATGNTMEQCLTSMKYLSKIMSEILK